MAPSLHWSVPQVICSITAEDDDRHVLIQIEYIIDAAISDKFGCAIRELKNLLRDGATNWDTFYDVANPNRYVESFRAESWIQYLRFHERFTKTDKEIENRVLAFYIGKVAPVVTTHSMLFSLMSMTINLSKMLLTRVVPTVKLSQQGKVDVCD